MTAGVVFFVHLGSDAACGKTLAKHFGLTISHCSVAGLYLVMNSLASALVPTNGGPERLVETRACHRHEQLVMRSRIRAFVTLEPCCRSAQERRRLVTMTGRELSSVTYRLHRWEPARIRPLAKRHRPACRKMIGSA